MKAFMGRKLLSTFVPDHSIEIKDAKSFAEHMERTPESGYVFFRAKDILKLLAKIPKNNSK